MKSILLILGVSIAPPLMVYMFLSGKQAKVIWMVLSFLYIYSLFRFYIKDEHPMTWAICLWVLMILSMSWYKDFTRYGFSSSNGSTYEDCEVNRYGIQVCN